MRRWWWVLLFVVAVLVLPFLLKREAGEPASGGFPPPWSWITSSRRTPPPVTGPRAPYAPEVRADGESIPTILGSYCWTVGDASVCADAVAPQEVIALMGWAPPVAPGARVKVSFPGPLLAGSLGVTHFSGVGAAVKIELDGDSSFQVPTDAGRYIYAVHGRWPQGDASYVFALEVHDAAVQAPPLLVRMDGEPVLTVRGGACWGSGGRVTCTDMLSPAEQLATGSLPVRKGGALIEVAFTEGPVTFEVVRVSEAGRVVAGGPDGVLRLPIEPGRYVYEVEAKWPEGDGYYGFGVQVR